LATTPDLEGQVICSQGFLPLAYDEPTSNCKAAVVCTLDRGPRRVLSAGPAESRFFNEVVTPSPFPTWFGTGLGGNLRMGTRGNAKKGKTQREMDRCSKTEHDKPWTDRRGY
jgi:hypothetical protein